MSDEYGSDGPRDGEMNIKKVLRTLAKNLEAAAARTPPPKCDGTSSRFISAIVQRELYNVTYGVRTPIKDDEPL
jgi:hypothetical protein